MMKATKQTILAPPLLFDSGLAHHRAGRLTDAADCYAAVLEIDPGHADALNLSGILARQQGDLEASEKLARRAIRHNAMAATYHHSLARTLAERGLVDEAMQSYRQALALNPLDPDSLQMLANLLSEANESSEAIELYQRLLTLAPEQTQLYLVISAVYRTAGDLDSAIAYARRAVERFPHVGECYIYLADCLAETKNAQEAVPVYRRGLELDPDNAPAHTRLGLVLHQANALQEARLCYLRALEIDPDIPDALSALGMITLGLGHPLLAEKLIRRALALNPDFLSANCNLGGVLERHGRYLEAVEYLRKALATDPHHVPTLANLGLTLGNMGDHAGAAACYELALEQEPEAPNVLFNLGLEYLMAGDFARGWPAYEARWRTTIFLGKRPDFPQPLWHGDDIRGRTILIYAEQGLGDTLQFIRFIPLVALRGARVILQVQAPLLELLRGTPGADLVLSSDFVATDNDPAPLFDLHCPLMSLPVLLGIELNSIPPPLPFPCQPNASAGALAARINAPGLRVGLVWSGSPVHVRDQQRSIPLAALATLFQLENVTFYSLQKGAATVQLEQLPSHQRPIDLNAQLLDFTHTAQVIRNLDLVITVDTAVCHLAGTLGKPVWILLPYVADWRWLMDRSDNPWYPNVRLFRQSAVNRWDDVVERVHEELCWMVHPLPQPTELQFLEGAP